jgi:hypothetical protein
MLSPKAADGSAGSRKAYVKPALKDYGNVNTVTQNIDMSSGAMDGGSNSLKT